MVKQGLVAPSSRVRFSYKPPKIVLLPPSSTGLEHPADNREVTGSSPVVATNLGRIAQQVEQEAFNLSVQGSIPCAPTKFWECSSIGLEQPAFNR